MADPNVAHAEQERLQHTHAGRYLVTVNRGTRTDDARTVFTRHGGYDRATAPRA